MSKKALRKPDRWGDCTPIKIDTVCAWCDLGVSPEDEEIIVTELGTVFHLKCWLLLLKEAWSCRAT